MAHDAFRLALGTLTVLPAGPVGDLDRRTAGRAMLLAPLAVLPLGVAAALVGGLGALLQLPSLGVGLLVVASLALLTRALHLDGLADTVDGLGSGWDPERALAVMKRGDVGPMGVVALVLVLLLQASAFGALVQGPATAALAGLVVCLSRSAVAGVCVTGLRAARPTGLGATVAGTVSRPGAVTSAVGAAVLLTAVAASTGPGPVRGLVAAALAVVVVVVLVRHAARRFGGVTGDVMGAAVELALTALLLGLVA
ncbi:MAG: cobV [Friedmanniella sp.]|nr:cobV [Friedmanniella sp.]